MTDKLNIIFSLQEKKDKKENSYSEEELYSNILEEVDRINDEIEKEDEESFDEVVCDIHDIMAHQINYSTNYTKKSLEKIADYYEIPKRRKKKDELIEAIVLYENDPENIYEVYQRRKLWGYIKDLKEDKYLRQFIIFD